MSATLDIPSLDLRDQVARIERALAETRTLHAKMGKLISEVATSRCDPWFILAGAMVGAVATQLPALLRGWD